MSGSILIVARNSLHLTKKAINSALAQDVSCTVLAVDNASSDSTWVWLKTKPIALISYEGQKSLAACWNAGLRAFWSTGAEEVLVINNDVELQPQTYRLLRELSLPFVTGVSVRSKEQLVLPDIGSTADLSAHPDFSCFMIRRDVWDKVGPFDGDYYPAYFEDNAYHIRMHRAGFIAHGANLPFYHESSGTLKNCSPQDKHIIERGFMLNKEKFKRTYGCYPGTPEYDQLFSQLPLLRKSTPTV